MLNIWFARDNAPLGLIAQAKIMGIEHWQAVEKEKRQGVILCVFHHTYMESMGLLLGHLGRVHPVYRPQDNALLEAQSAMARSRWTAGAVSNREVRQMVRLLKQKETLWLAPDQRNRSDGVPIPFMGQQALTHLSIARLARLTKAQIIPVTCHRSTEGVLELTFHPALQGMTEKTDVAVLTELMQILEQEVHAYPEQYFWVHDRFNIGRQRC
jgi:KDO2-lipid IV(A) lauroyltransferase